MLTFCGRCGTALNDEEQRAFGTGSADDHLPCGLPGEVVYAPDGIVWEGIRPAPVGSPLEHEDCYLHANFHPTYHCAGMGV